MNVQQFLCQPYLPQQKEFIEELRKRMSGMVVIEPENARFYFDSLVTKVAMILATDVKESSGSLTIESDLPTAFKVVADKEYQEHGIVTAEIIAGLEIHNLPKNLELQKKFFYSLLTWIDWSLLLHKGVSQ